jgi:uracil-DNA glycosylase family 4
MDAPLFSPPTRRVRAPLSMYPACDRCGLSRRCKTPKMEVDGEGRRRVMIVGDYPGKDEDRDGRPWAGKAGDLLRRKLGELDVSLRRDCWLLNALSCYSPKPTEHKTAVTDCRPKVMSAIRRLRPDVIILAGQQAVKSVLGYFWKEKVGPVGRWVGWRIPNHEPNAWVCPTYNPAALLYDDTDPVQELDFTRHLTDAFELRGRPWPDGPPDYGSRVRVLMDPADAVRWLRGVKTGTIAFDYETTCLKPEGPGSRIVCCSVCHRGETIAFPWIGDVRSAMKDILTNPDVRKIASNLDMEDRCTRHHLEIEVAGWYWDIMLGAHTIDPRGDADRKSNDGITGLKFQSFVRLGQPVYNEHIEPYLVPDQKGGYALNRIHELKPHDLLRYNGMDSVLEYEVARHQMTEMGIQFEE